MIHTIHLNTINMKLHCTCTLVVLTLSLSFYGCSKSGTTAPKPPVVVKTTTDTLTSAPWKFFEFSVIDNITNTPYVLYPAPDTVQNLVLTLNTDHTFTETGPKTASGTWAINTAVLHGITITTTSTPASTITWTYYLTATELLLTNTQIKVNYVNPTNTLDYYQGEQFQFSH